MRKSVIVKYEPLPRTGDGYPGREPKSARARGPLRQGARRTLNPKPCTLIPIPYTSGPTPQTLNPKPQSLNLKPICVKVLTHSLARSLTRTLAHSHNRSLTRTLTHSITHSRTD